MTPYFPLRIWGIIEHQMLLRGGGVAAQDVKLSNFKLDALFTISTHPKLETNFKTLLQAYVLK